MIRVSGGWAFLNGPWHRADAEKKTGKSMKHGGYYLMVFKKTDGGWKNLPRHLERRRPGGSCTRVRQIANGTAEGRRGKMRLADGSNFAVESKSTDKIMKTVSQVPKESRLGKLSGQKKGLSDHLPKPLILFGWGTRIRTLINGVRVQKITKFNPLI